MPSTKPFHELRRRLAECRYCADTGTVVEIEPGGDGPYRHAYPCPTCADTRPDVHDHAAAVEAVLPRSCVTCGNPDWCPGCDPAG